MQGGPAGDLYVVIEVREHAIFQRDGKHLFCEVPISFADAALGAELEVPTLDGRVKLKVPEGTQTGKQFRLRGKGVSPVRGGGVGDLMCRVVVETPVKLMTQCQSWSLTEMCDLILSTKRHEVDHEDALKSWASTAQGFWEYLLHCEVDAHFIAILFIIRGSLLLTVSLVRADVLPTIELMKQNVLVPLSTSTT